mmetsp:Transcript_18824/g.36914  ORF Transcript_18824/g.36914 Transcript_18824/m.36914 type:complete len:711 (+) Transcript_18824:177-2309(+)
MDTKDGGPEANNSSSATSVLEAWQAIDLGNVQLALDDQASKVAEYRESCTASRNKLATKTREFKKREDVRKADENSVIKTEVRKLLRSYQEEVDTLTTRAKFAENCFLSMYRLIREAPDPSYALADASRISFEADMGISEMKKACFEKDQEIAKLQKRLEANKVFQSKSDQNAIDEEVSAELERIRAEEAERREALVHEMDQKYQDQLEEFRSKAEEDLANLTMQLEMTHSDLENQTEQVQVLQNKLRELGEARDAADGSSQQGASSADANPSGNKGSSAHLSLEEENSRLLRDLQVAQEEQERLLAEFATTRQEFEGNQERHEQEIQQLTHALNDKSEHLASAREQLSAAVSREDYDRLRRKFALIQRELYNVHDDGEENFAAETGPNGSSSSGDPIDEPDSLEAFFVKSTRQLKEDLMVAKMTIEEQRAEIRLLKETEQRLSDALKDQRDLASKLESDLALGTTSLPATVSAVKPLPDFSDMNLSADLIPASAQSSGEMSAVQDVTALVESTPTGNTTVGQSQKQVQALNSMLQAVCAQRNRLRAQLQANEEELDIQRRKIQDSEQRMKSMQEDNVQLYQRIRFLQNYKASERSTLISEGLPSGAIEDIESATPGRTGGVMVSAQGVAKVAGLGRGVEHRYRNLYESDIDPLKAFKQQESERLYQTIPQVERVAITVCNAFLTRSRGRVFLVVYTALLHLAVAFCWLR